MYGFILRMDAGRQSRVGTEPLKACLKPATYAKVLQNETKLNAGRDMTCPFAPTIVRPEFYPAFLRATDIRTIFWKIKNVSDFHDLVRAYVDTDSTFVLEFATAPDKDKVTYLCELLEHCDHLELHYKEQSGKKVKFDITCLSCSTEVPAEE